MDINYTESVFDKICWDIYKYTVYIYTHIIITLRFEKNYFIYKLKFQLFSISYAYFWILESFILCISVFSYCFITFLSCPVALLYHLMFISYINASFLVINGNECYYSFLAIFYQFITSLNPCVIGYFSQKVRAHGFKCWFSRILVALSLNVECFWDVKEYKCFDWVGSIFFLFRQI